MRSSVPRLLIPAGIVVIVVGVAILLLTQQGASPSCGELIVKAGEPVTLEDGTRVSVLDDEAVLRFDGAVLGESELIAEANAHVRAAVNAMPVNLRARGSILVFTRCRDVAIPIHLEIPPPDASLDAYVWDGTQWTWLAGSTGQLSVDLPNLPQYVAWVETLPSAPIIGTEPDPRSAGLDPQYSGIITELYAPGLTVTASGSVTGQAPAAPPQNAPYAAFPVISDRTEQGRDFRSVEAMLSDAAARQNHIGTLAAIATGANFAGIAIDYSLSASARDAYAAFVEELAERLHASGKLLVVVLPPPRLPHEPGPVSEDAGAYDWTRIGRAADILQFMLVYDNRQEAYASSVLDWVVTKVDRHKAQPILTAESLESAGGQLVPVSFAYAVSGLPLSEATTVSATVGSAATFVLLDASATLTVDTASGTYRYAARGGSALERSIRTAATLAGQLRLVSGRGLRGVTLRGVLGADAAPNLVEPIRAFRQQTAALGSADLDVSWTIAAADGSPVVEAARPLANAELSWTPDQDGAYTVKAAIASVEREIARVTVGAAETAGRGGGGVDACYDASYVADVTVPDNTRFDKNKDFTKTWKVRNSGTCVWDADTEIAFVSGAQLGAASPVKVGALAAGQSMDISVPMKAADKDGAYTGIWQLRNKDGAFGDRLSVVIKVGAEVAAPPPVAPPAGGGRIEYGIHAHYYGYAWDYEYGAQNISSLTNELGLGWVKIQFRWGDYDYYCGGADLNVLNTMVNRANAAGLKVLISVVTSPPCKHPWTGDVHAPPDDANELAGLVGGLADFYKGRIHAIEIWNEQNIDREWRTSPQVLDASRYTQLLAAGYNAIKAKDPNILVVSGAPAPTGVSNGVTATDDFTYLQQMVAAGAAKYMDCVGTHVNALRVPPSAGLGGEYDSLFSPPHHSWYFKDTVQGYQSITGKPACVTEFGVATQEGVGNVSGFEWAADNTQQEQADWVTEGMSLCKQWGCRLMILWNLDYGPATGTVNDNALYSFLDMGWGKRPVFSAVKNWCAANGCR